MTILCFWLMIFSVYLVSRLQRIDDYLILTYGSMFETSRDFKEILHKCYNFIFMIRRVLYAIILVVCYKHPITQLYLIITILIIPVIFIYIIDNLDISIFNTLQAI